MKKLLRNILICDVSGKQSSKRLIGLVSFAFTLLICLILTGIIIYATIFHNDTKHVVELSTILIRIIDILLLFGAGALGITEITKFQYFKNANKNNSNNK